MTDPTDINGSADMDGDGISNKKEMEIALDMCGNTVSLDANYDQYCDLKYDVALPAIEQPKWEIQVASNGDQIISIKEQYATDNAKKFFSVADSAGSTTAMTFDEANAY
ncbi:MAG: hypothetical protein IE880_05060, partial [Epsilonproteobacteria bacterium]|nr:hypothetical protein [Campylobacterota bacterium]